MSFFDDLLKLGGEGIDALKTSVKRFANDNFANAAMATCAIIGAADGKIDSSEKQKIGKLITSNEMLSVFKPTELLEKFNKYCDKINADQDFGKIECIEVIGKIKSHPEQGRAMVMIGCAIGAADGNFDVNEKAAVIEICNAVGIDSNQFTALK